MQILLKIENITNYITFPPTAEDILQVKGLYYIDGLNNSGDTTIQ